MNDILHIRLAIKILGLCFILIFEHVSRVEIVVAQEKPNSAKPTNCEINILYIDEALAQIESSESPLIVIAHLGDGEESQTWNKRRLSNLQSYIKKFRSSKARIILAQGEKVKGFGQMNIYVNGQLFRTLVVRRNKDIPVGTCTDDKRNCIFYPWRSNSKLRPCWPG
jgi:hypothetical protein